MYGVVYNDPRLKQTIGDRGEAELGYQFIGGIFAFACFVFFLVWLGSNSRERKAVSFAMMSICSIPMLTYGFIIPYRLGLTFQDLNGNPLDIAPHWEATCMTPLLIFVIGEITKTRDISHDSNFWNIWVFVFGVAGMIITTEPMSPLFLWLSMGCYSIQLKLVSKQFSLAAESGSTMSGNGLTMTKYAYLLGNHIPVVMYGLHRFQLIPFSQFVVLDALGQWTAKFVFGMIIISNLGDRLIFEKQD
jgi:hypothetical protein